MAIFCLFSPSFLARTRPHSFFHITLISTQRFNTHTMPGKKELIPREVRPLVILVSTAGLVGATVAFMTLKKGRESQAKPWPYMEKDPAKVSEMRRQLGTAEYNERMEDRQTAQRVHDVLKNAPQHENR